MGKVIVRGEHARNLAIDIVKNGGTFEDAAKETGYRVDYVRQLCTKAGIYMPKFTKSEERREKAILLLKQGKSVDDVMTMCGYASKCIVLRIAKQNNIEAETEFGINMKQRDEYIISLRTSGLSYKEIADKTGINKPLVASICRRHGFGGVVAKGKRIGLGSGETRTCPVCGKTFECGTNHNKKYCSTKCQKKVSDTIAGLKRRAQIVIVDKDISLERLYKRDNGICHICGCKTDWNDVRVVKGKRYSLRNYPTIDHIIPISRGGSHSWENVALAHMGCNSAKCNRMYG